MGLFSRKSAEPMTLERTKEFLGLSQADFIWDDPVVTRMTIPRADFGIDKFWYPGEMVNMGKRVEIRVAGKKVADLSQRTLADAVEVFRAYAKNKVPVALEGQRDDKTTQAVIAKRVPPAKG